LAGAERAPIQAIAASIEGPPDLGEGPLAGQLLGERRRWPSTELNQRVDICVAAQ
jgi:hypothetical protein